MEDKITAVIGTNSWGSAFYEKAIRGDAVDTSVLKDAMKVAAEKGLFYVDSARDYGFGKGPKLIGECCMDEIKISSKFTPIKRYKKGCVIKSFYKDLEDFKRDSVDIFWLHIPNDVSENLSEIISLYREGKIKEIGISNFNLEECKEAKAILDKEGIPLYGVQNHYSLLSREAEEFGILSWCKENNISFWAWAPLEEGILTGPKKKKEKFSLMKVHFRRKRKKLAPLFEKMKEIGELHGLSIAEVAVSFVSSRGMIPIVGCRKPYQTESLARAVSVTLSPDEMNELISISDKLSVKILNPEMFRFTVRKKKKK